MLRPMNEPKKNVLFVSISIAILASLLYIFFWSDRFGNPASAGIESHYVVSDSPPSDRKTLCVVFVHGIFGNDSTWGKGETSLPKLLLSDPAFDGKVDAFLFEYTSPWLKNASSISQLSRKLSGALKDNHVWDYQKVIFVAHSMGGIVVREYLVAHRDHISQIPMMYFYAVPTDGATLTRSASRISGNPQLRGMLPLEDNDFLDGVQDAWMGDKELKRLPTFCAFENLRLTAS